jgi:hypothetical protein
MTEQEARRKLETRAHGLKVCLGRVRAAARRSETLDEKVALQRRARALEQELRLLHKNYWLEVGRLEEATEGEAQSSDRQAESTVREYSSG